MAEETIDVGEGRPGASPRRSLGPYRIEREIGRGGMAVVYRALHVPLDRVVALKVLLPSLSGDAEFVDRFLAEARAAARLDYPHIVPIYDSGEITHTYYIAMKLLEGRDLKTVLAERRSSGTPGLPLERTIGIASQVAGALEYAHQHRLVHRDVKPANIIVDENDRALLTDFGIARALDGASVTLPGMVVGTPTYMSPEQAQAKPVDYRSDLYSLGVVVYEMLTGVPPFTGNPQTILYAHVSTPPPPLDHFNAAVPAGVADVVLRALAKNPDDRFESAGALALALSNAAGSELAAQALTTADIPPAVAPTSRGVAQGNESRSSGSISTAPADASLGTPAWDRPSAAAARRPRALILSVGGAALALLIAAVIWLVLAGPFASGDGRLSVTSIPAGAEVSVDGRMLGTTPLAGVKLPPGNHMLLIGAPTYASVQRSEKISSHANNHLNFTLAPLPASDLLSVKSAVVAADIGQDASGAITFGSVVTSVRAGQQFGLIVTLVQTTPGARDITANYEFVLFDANGNRLRTSPPATLTVKKDDTQGQSVAFKFTFLDPKSAGSYMLALFLDNKEIVSKPVALVQ